MILPTLSSVVRSTYASMSSHYCVYLFLLIELSACDVTVKKEGDLSSVEAHQIKDYKNYLNHPVMKQLNLKVYRFSCMGKILEM